VALRVLLICGSLQAKSSNRAVLEVVWARLAESAADVEESTSVGHIPAFNPDHQDIGGDVVAEFRDQIARCDAVVISTPEYAAGIPGALKNALDWIVGSGELYGKPVALLSAGTTGGRYARDQLIRSLTWQGAHIFAQLGVTAPRTKSDRGGRIVDPITVGAIDDLTDVILRIGQLPPDDRLKLVEQITGAAGVEAGHIAPVPEGRADWPRQRSEPRVGSIPEQTSGPHIR